MTEPATPHLVTTQATLPPVRDLNRTTDLLADYLHDHPHVTDPGLTTNLTTGQLDVHLTIHATDQEAAESRGEEILRDGIVHAVMTAAAEVIRDESTYWPIGHEALNARPGLAESRRPTAPRTPPSTKPRSRP